MILTGVFWCSVGCLWMLGPWCCQPLAVEKSWLLQLTHLYLLSFSSLWIDLVYAMMILNMSMYKTGTSGEGGKEIM